MPAYAGICKYVPAYAASCGDKPYNCVKQFFVKLKHKKWYIYYIYDFRRAIYNDIAASTSVLYRPREKKTLGQGRALGPSALVHGPALGFFFTSDEKEPRCRGYIVVYSPPKIIYTLHIRPLPLKKYFTPSRNIYDFARRTAGKNGYM